MIPEQTEASQKDMRPRHKSVRRDESDFAWYIFVWALFSHVLKIRDQTLITQKYTKQIWILLAESFP